MKKVIIFIICLILILTNLPYKEKTEDNADTLLNAVEYFYQNIEGNLRIMTYNLLSHEIGFDGIFSEKRLSDIISLINSVQPDILCLQEVSSDYYKLLKAQTELQFISYIGNYLSRSMTVMMFNPERLTLSDCGCEVYRYSTNSRLRRYNWGIFEDRKTGECFVAINTHLNLYEQAAAYPVLQATELIDFCNEIQEKYNYPLFIAGDFNSYQSTATSNTTVYSLLSRYCVDAKLLSQSKSYGIDKTLSSPVTDHIFCTDNVTVLSYTLLSQPQLNTLSDHYAVFIDVSFNTS